jgi:SAM-dependent methyltransferase
MGISEKEHWEKIYQNKPEEELSWFQIYPKTSMEFLELFSLPLTAKIIDIGGGSSHFADVLLERGYTNIWVLDISELAIASAKKRLGEKAIRINWVVEDITAFNPSVQFDFWHDRAAFHFLTSEEKINKYISIAEKAIKKDGYMVLGTFSENGPEKCSGLDIKQYSEASMSGRFGVSFERIKCIHEAHFTPSNLVQNFLFCSFRRK